MKYNGYLQTVSQNIERIFSEISAEHNFDLGDEFETALCRALRIILPQKYGICRGFVVTEDSQMAGDDIIIYDRESFPTLRLLPQDTYDRKEHIPFDAVYAYIEAKHTINLYGDDGQSLQKALAQVANVKGLPRKPRLPIQYDSHLSFSEEVIIDRQGMPPILNPVYGAIIARHVRLKKGEPVEQNPQTVKEHLISTGIFSPYPPDLIVTGNSVIANSCIDNRNPDDPKQGHIITTPFFIPNISKHIVKTTTDKAFALGICSLLWAIDTIRLSPLPWSRILEEGSR